MQIFSGVKRTLLLLLSGLLFLTVGFFSNVNATHIVGGEIYYECLNPAQDLYRVTLVMYRDCLLGEAPYDDPISFFVFDNTDGSIFQINDIPIPEFIPEIVPDGWDTCVGQPYDLCVERAVYTKNFRFVRNAAGYTLSWARCCRNSAITNLFNPLDQGITFTTRIPGSGDAVCNSSPRFNQTLPTFICNGEIFSFDHSATDPDGDSLVYSMGTPLTGLNTAGLGASNAQGGNPGPTVGVSNAMGPPPYRPVDYVGIFYSPTNPFNPNNQPSASIDPHTGFLIFQPQVVGIFVVAITVTEYRNGIFLSAHTFDIQVHVLACQNLGFPPTASHDFSDLDTTNPGISLTYGVNDTIYAIAGTPFCYTVEVRDTILSDQVISFPVSEQFGTGTFFPPAATIQTIGNNTNPVIVEVCWAPACEYIGDTLDLIVGGRDSDGCVNHGYAYDTVFIVVLPPPIVQPIVTYDPLLGDTVFIDVGDNLCFDWWVTDEFDQGHLGFEVYYVLNGQTIRPFTQVEKFQDSIALSSCFFGACELQGQTIDIIMVGNDNSFCPPDGQDRDTLSIFINYEPYPYPILYHDLNGNDSISGDTLFIDVHDTICYTFTLDDTLPTNGLDYQFSIANQTGGFSGPVPSLDTLIIGDSLVIRVCWIPACANADATFLLAAQGTQYHNCNQQTHAYDTVWVVVRDVVNPPPTMSFLPDPGLLTIGDTTWVVSDSLVCFDFEVRDSGLNTALDFSYEIVVLPGLTPNGQGAIVTYFDSSATLLRGRICWIPGCDVGEKTIRIAVIGRDTFDCNPSNWLFDTAFVQVTNPVTLPPVIGHDLSGLNLNPQDGFVEVFPIGRPFCYTVIVTDPDSGGAVLSSEGIGPVFDENFGHGNPAVISVSGTNPMIVEVCWDPSCYEAEQEFALVICARDSSRCDLEGEVCDTVWFRVLECKIQNENVFSPNGDQKNDTFLPFDMQGVESYSMKIFDRWGNLIHSNQNTEWNGLKTDGSPAHEGVYFWIIEYTYWSASGDKLGDRGAGNVTLMR